MSAGGLVEPAILLTAWRADEPNEDEGDQDGGARRGMDKSALAVRWRKPSETGEERSSTG